jgi:hypothetical protein
MHLYTTGITEPRYPGGILYVVSVARDRHPETNSDLSLLAESTSLGVTALDLSMSQGSTRASSTSLIARTCAHSLKGNGSILFVDSLLHGLHKIRVLVADSGNISNLRDRLSEALAVKLGVLVCKFR